MGAAAADAAMAKVACVACLTPNRLPVERAGDAPKCGQCGAPLLDGKPASLDEASFDGVVGRTDLPVVVDFWAPWCGPCRAIPTLVLFRDGQEAKRASGAMDARSLARWVESR